MAKDAWMSVGIQVDEEFLDVATIKKDTFKLRGSDGPDNPARRSPRRGQDHYH